MISNIKSKLPFIGGDDELEDDEEAEEQEAEQEEQEPDEDVDAEQGGDDAPDIETDPLEPDPASYSPEDVDKYTDSDEQIAEYEIPDGNVVDDEGRLHKDFVAPSELQVEKETIKAGEKWVQSVFVNSWPEIIRDGFLNSIFSDSSMDTDITIHLDPRDQETAKTQLQDRIGAIEADLEERQKQGASAEARDVQQKLKITQQMYDLVSRQGMTLFDVSMYINHRGYDQDDVRSQLSEIRGLMERPPANTDIKVATRRQDKGMVSASPVGHDELNKKNAMLGGGAGAMMPFTSSTRIEENGVDFGVQPYNGSPIIVNRFGRDTGYNMMTIGNIGSGKSFSTKLNLVRTLQRRSDVDVVMLDPLEGFIGVNKALNGERIVVGGNVGLNPLELQETPKEILEQAGEGLDPYAAKLKDVMSFFETFFAMRGDHLDDERRGVLEKAVQKAYADAGITRDPDTHSRDSPTLDDVLNNLESMAQEPQNFTRSEAEQEQQRISKFASDLLVGMQPFSEGGEFENLTKATEIDISESRITYLDLQQQEGSGGTGLMMQLLFNMVYERAKQIDNKMIFVIDEARYIMKDAASLEFLEQAVRHSRHYDLSIQFVTQTVDEFFAQEEAEAIANNCAIVQLNRVEGLDDEVAVNKLGLNKQQAEFVRNALPGDKERGYSECLLGVEGDWYPIHVKASDAEAMAVDFEPDEMDRSDLPGYERVEGSEREQRIEEAVEVGVAKETPEAKGTGKTVEEKLEDLDAVGFEDDEDVIEEESAQVDTDDLGRDDLIELIQRGDFSHVDVEDLQIDDDLQSAIQDREGTTMSADTPSADEIDSGGMFEDTDVSSGSWSEPEEGEEGTRIYYVEIEVDDSATDPNSDEMPVVDSLGDAFTIYATDPSPLAIKAGDYELGFDAVIATSHDEHTIQNALDDLNEVANSKTADITNQIELAEAEGLDAGELKDVREETEEEEGRASNEIFNELKEEVEEYEDHAQVEEDMEDIEFDKIDDDTDEVSFDELVETDPDEFQFGESD